MSMNLTQQTLAIELFKRSAIRFDPNGFKFNLHKEHPEAPLSPNYVDLRNVFRDNALRNMIVEMFLPLLDCKPDVLVDLPLSISPITTVLSFSSGIPMITIRSEALKGTTKDHGIAENILGFFSSGQKGVILDDVVSSLAFTKMKAIEVLKSAGLVVIPKIYVVMDRDEGGRDFLERQGIELVSLLRFHEVLDLYLKKAMITPALYDGSLVYSQAAKKYALGA